MKHIAITGATGFLGSHVLPWLSEPDYRVSMLRRGEGADVIERLKPDIILHMATNYGRVADANINAVNVDLPKMLLAAGMQNGLQRFINIDTMLPAEVSQYAASKAAFRNYLSKQTGITVVNLAFDLIYGRGDSGFVGSIIRRLLVGENSIALTAGAQKRDLIHAQDCADAIARVLAMDVTGIQSFHVLSGEQPTIRELVERLKILTDNHKTQLQFGALAYRAHEPMQPQPHLDSALLSNFSCRWQLPEGLLSVIDDLREQ